jgi:hypothetical protein
MSDITYFFDSVYFEELTGNKHTRIIQKALIDAQ